MNDKKSTIDSVTFLMFAEYVGYTSKFIDLVSEYFEKPNANISEGMERILQVEALVFYWQMQNELTTDEIVKYWEEWIESLAIANNMNLLY